MSHPVTFCEVDAQSVFGRADQQFHQLSATMVWNAKKLDVEVLCQMVVLFTDALSGIKLDMFSM